MPYKSMAQERWAHTPEGMKSLGGPERVKEWDQSSRGLKLPRRAAGALVPPHLREKFAPGSGKKSSN